jgi:hypothetical protein
MAETRKPMSEKDYAQVIKSVFNDTDKSLTINGFLVGRVGHKVTLTLSTTNFVNDTETYSFYDNGTLLYSIRIIYTDSTRSVMLEAERIE